MIERMQQQSYSLVIEAPRQGLHDITAEIADWLTGQPVRSGLLTVFIRHSSASRLIQENWDDDVVADLEAFFTKLVPEESMLYRHIAEGDDDMPAHIKGALTQTHLNIPVRERQLRLGRYQGVFLFEHRRKPRPRELDLHLIGD